MQIMKKFCIFMSICVCFYIEFIIFEFSKKKEDVFKRCLNMYSQGNFYQSSLNSKPSYLSCYLFDELI